MDRIQPFRDALASDWKSAWEQDEWFFTRLEEDIATRLSPSEAFVAIDEVATLIQQQRERFQIWRCGYFLITLARRSDTTEMPPVLKRDWDAIAGILRGESQTIEAIQSWYHLPRVVDGA